MRCTQCGALLEEKANFCNNCGAPCEWEPKESPEALNEAEVKKEPVLCCPNCGATLFPDDTFCNQCGAPITRPQTEKAEHRCPRCKTEYQPGAQFCPACGTQLGPGYAHSSPISDGLEQVSGFIRSYFKQPIKTTIAVAGEPSPVLPVILFLIYVAACGLQLFSMLQCFCDAVQSLLQSIFGVLAMTALIEAPFWTSLIFGALYGALFILLLSAVFFCCTKILNENCPVGVILRTTVAQSIVPSFLLLASAAAALLSPWLAILLFFLSQITWVVLMVLGLGTLSGRSQSGRFWLPFIAFLFAALLIFNFIEYKTGWQLAKNIAISYEDESMTISEIMESEGISDAGEFFESLLEELLY